MNLFDLFSLNRHGAYREVLFSSALSYLLNPHADHGLGTSFLFKTLNLLGVKLPKPEDIYKTVLQSEYCLDDEIEDDDSYGDIDIIVTSPDFVVGIEMKVWDRSADNVSKADQKQLSRYAKVLREMAAKNGHPDAWRLLFIVPRLGGPVCAEEFKSVYKEHACGNRCFVMPLMGVDTEDDIQRLARETSEQNVITAPLESLLKQVLSADGLLHDRTKWVIASYIDFLERRVLYRENPDPQRFPSLEDLSECNKCIPFLEMLTPFMDVEKRYPNARHTVIGIPYGRRREKVQFHGNCLYRIRTTRDFYGSFEEKDSHMPVTPLLQIELWPKVFAKCSSDLTAWLSSEARGTISGAEAVHLNEKRNTEVRLVEIARVWSRDEVREFRAILEKGFKLAMTQIGTRKT